MSARAEMDPYIVLGVSRTATATQIRDAYRTLGARYHPDRHQGNPLQELASAKMAELNRAYEILSDPARRRAFDGVTSGIGAAPADFGAPRPAVSRRAAGIVAVMVLLPLLLRFGGLLLRGLTALGREVIEGISLARGTPLGLSIVVATIALLIFALVRRRLRR
jgi:curved DNA-binding protein CbpA